MFGDVVCCCWAKAAAAVVSVVAAAVVMCRCYYCAGSAGHRRCCWLLLPAAVGGPAPPASWSPLSLDDDFLALRLSASDLKRIFNFSVTRSNVRMFFGWLVGRLVGRSVA